MYKQGVPGFKYFVGIDSLAKVATREDRVCVLNILGGESSDVTPVSHAFSGGNVVFGTSPGRGGQKLKTPIGDVPVFNSVREGLNAGHRFNTGVVYLPPSAVRDGVAELVRVNPDLEKIVIVTEKVSVHDAREIRAIGQTNGIDIFGANGLGVADAWNRVRIGGALGGDNPGETLLKGSVAIFSNSGNFTTTIANYLATAGWGTTTSISSGKDVYIHFAAPEFVHALGNDERSKAAVHVRRARRLLRARAAVEEAHRRLRRRPLEGQADPRRGPCRRHGRLRRRRRVEGTLVHGDVRRRRHLHARTTRSARPRVPWSPTSPTSRRR